VDNVIGLEIIEVVEQAAIASARLMGKGEKDEADRVAVEAMRERMNKIHMRGRIVIGEGERDDAPMLYIGEQVGICTREDAKDVCNLDELIEIDIAVDPCEGTNLVAYGQNGSMAVLAISEKGGVCGTGFLHEQIGCSCSCQKSCRYSQDANPKPKNYL
jgi:fructose-1,6-bisphosphatase II / sedoheptulose-1,7-bisphosphatase